MRQHSFEETNTSQGRKGIKDVRRAGSSRPENGTASHIVFLSDKNKASKKFTNIKSRLIGFVGTFLISLIVYNLIANYWDLI